MKPGEGRVKLAFIVTFNVTAAEAESVAASNAPVEDGLFARALGYVTEWRNGEQLPLSIDVEEVIQDSDWKD